MKTIWTAQQRQGGWFKAAVLAVWAGMSLAVVAQESVAQRPAEELDVLLGPVALYPDALIAVMLPAATAPADVVLAARYLATGGEVDQLEAQPWDDSVRTLAHYPELTQWMADNLVWTTAVGDAFRAQPADVMAAVQRLRVRAQTLGNLTSTPQQRVISDQNVITIIPAEPEVVYVPQYDPQVVYLQPAPFGGSWINYGFWWRIGSWHRYDFDWHRCNVRMREQHPQYRHPVEVIRAWHPAPAAPHQYPAGTRAPAVQQARPTAVSDRPHNQAHQVVVPKTQAVFGPTQRETSQHNTSVTRPVEHVATPVSVRHESSANNQRTGDNHGTFNRASLPQPVVQRSVPVARPEPRAVPRPVSAPVAPVMQTPQQHHDAAPHQNAPNFVQRNVPVARPEQRVTVSTRAAPVAPVMQTPQQHHDAASHQNAPNFVQHNLPVARPEQRVTVSTRAAPVAQTVQRHESVARQPAPAVAQRVMPPVQYARPDNRVMQAQQALARPSAPVAAPRVMHAAPAAQPVPQPAAVRAAPAAPQQLRQVVPAGNNQPGSKDRSANGRWGNMARGN